MFYKEIKEIEKNISISNDNIKKIKLKMTDEKFNAMNFKQKSKLNSYIELYGMCESEYNELSNKFLMKYN